RLYGTRGHRRLIASLLVEPGVRLTAGILLALSLGAVGGAGGVIVGGYGALEIARRVGGRRGARRGLRRTAGTATDELAATGDAAAELAAAEAVAVPGVAAVTPLSSAEPASGSRRALQGPLVWTGVCFLLVAVVQNQDLLIANRVLPPALAGQFAVLSTLGGITAFATLTVPLVLLPRTAGGDRTALVPALGLTALIGGCAVAVAALDPGELVGGLFGMRYEPVAGLAAPYLLAMALLGIGRVLAAHACALHWGRRTAAVATLAAALQAALVVELGRDPRDVALSTLAATAFFSVVLFGMVIVVPAGRRAAPRLRVHVGAALIRVRTRRLAAGLLALTAAGAAIRLVIPRGLWLDEATSVHEASLSFGGMIHALYASDVHPPMYFCVLWGAIRLFGDGELAVRLPSIAAGVLTIPVLYLLGKEAYDRRTGLVAAAVGAVAPILVWYSQEARMYSMLALFGLIAVWAQVRILKRTPSGHVGAWPWIVYTVATVAMVWTQYFGLLQVVFQQLAFVWAVVARKHRGEPVRPLVTWWVLTGVVVFVGISLLMPFAYHQFAVNQNAGRGFGAPQQVTTAAALSGNHIGVYAILANLVWAVIGYQPNPTMLLLGALWPLGMLFALSLLGRKSQPVTALLVTVVLGPGVSLFLLGLVKPYLFDIRYLFPAVAVLAVLVARVLTGLVRHARPLAAVTGVVLVVMATFLVNQQANGSNPRRYDFATALTSIDHQDRRGDALLYSPSDLNYLVEYYSPHLHAARVTQHPRAPSAGRTLWVLESPILESSQGEKEKVAGAISYLERHSHLVGRTRYSNVEVWVFR
ncbi:MAG: glycosyltransferase family 39 protein, partial [Acidimicrobiales bacterium]